MAEKQKRKQLSIEKKLKILGEIDKKNVSKSEIARMFDIKKSTLFTILKNRDTISAASETGVSQSRIRSRDGKFPLLEKALLEWMQLMRSTNIPIDGNFLKEKAKTFAEKMNIDVDFKVSNGWFEKFKCRHGLSFKKLCGESASADLNCINGWRKEQLKRLLDQFEPIDIFNADETGLYYKLLPDKSIVMKGETGHGVKRSKQRITVLLAANMTGTEKLPLLILGQSPSPRCFKGVKSLPTTYKSNNKAWMTSDIFQEWLRNLYHKMTANKRKILLIIDNCTSHSVVNNLKSVKVQFLPPNVTSVLQPLDQGIIKNFKTNYRKMIVRRMIASIENKESYIIDILRALHLAKAAWAEVTKETIANCFRHAGFKTKEEFDKESDKVQNLEFRPSTSSDFPTQITNDEDQELMNLLGMTSSDYKHLKSEFVLVDDNLQCCEEFSNEDEFISQILTENDDPTSGCDNDQEECDDISNVKPSTKDASSSIEILRKYFEREDFMEDYLQKLTEMENFIVKSSQIASKQSQITNFFQR